MGVIDFRQVTKSYNGNVILDDIGFEIFKNEITALIGRNGSGKTTVFNIITGETPYDSGDMYIQKGLRLSYLKQIHEGVSGLCAEKVIKTAFEEIDDCELLMQRAYVDMQGDPENRILVQEYGRLHDRFEFMGGYNTGEKYNRIVKGLKIPNRILESDFDTLSGGERTTVMLAKSLLSAPDILLLDEPTNHLDMDARGWLEKFMLEYKGSIVYVSHDRYFIDKTASRIIEISGMKAISYKGNFSAYKKQKQEREERDLKLYEKQNREIDRLNETARKMRNYATEKTIHIAKTIEKRIEQINRVDRPVTEKTLHMAFAETIKSGREILKAEKLTAGYGSKLLFDDVDFLIRSGEKIAIIGPNGSGKSTMIKVVTGRMQQLKGVVRLGKGVKFAYLEQDVEFSHINTTVLEEVCAELEMSISSARNLLGKFLFTGDDVYKKISILSGGEKSRLRLLLEMRDSVNLLILDEPTNHLDIPSREDLEKAIRDYEGTMIFISHDRHFINTFADRIFEIRNGNFSIFTGNYDDYLEEVALREPVKMIIKKITEKPSRGKAKRKADFTLRRAEEKIQVLEQEILEVERHIQEFATDYVKLTELNEIREKLQIDLDNQFEKWMELTSE
ncbi:MAG: ABC-F family ATP-binding cassette domain-containing protein [Clostridiales bacterium]|nr:ABC-F family ATP-binding cassette domain-containing protein [Clostridiales bacterium]